MNKITLLDLINNLKTYNSDEVDIVTKAYYFAEYHHHGQFRQSGEPYIIHPLNVAYTLSLMHADRDTIIAGLLHDLLEDTTVTKEEIASEFNPTVANLVYGVTKMSKTLFKTRNEEFCANTRKLIMGISGDVRIIIIKLADRLHNMRTLEYKTRQKQIENAKETMEIFVPIAQLIGAYQIKCELEDVSLLYLEPEEYVKYFNMREKLVTEYKSMINDVLSQVYELLCTDNIPSEIKYQIKNIYGIYKSCQSGAELTRIHDLIALEIMVSSIRECYQTLGILHTNFASIDYAFKDYIATPKPNMYQSLHTGIMVPEKGIVQAQIRTFEMEDIDKYGLIAYWDKLKGKAKDVMQSDLQMKFPFYQELAKINATCTNNQDFVNQVKNKLFTDKITVSTSKGSFFQILPSTTVSEFAYFVNPEMGLSVVGAFVNGKQVPLDYTLKSGDRIEIINEPPAFSTVKNSPLVLKKS